MVEYFMNKVLKKNIFKPRIVASVSSDSTDVERRTLISVLISAGARSVCLLEQPICAAFGAGVDPINPTGVFVIDIGAGSTDMAVISQVKVLPIQHFVLQTQVTLQGVLLMYHRMLLFVTMIADATTVLL